MVRGSGHRRKGQIVTRTCLFSSFFFGFEQYIGGGHFELRMGLGQITTGMPWR